MGNFSDNPFQETHPAFESGDWSGFFTYTFGTSAVRHTMSHILKFHQGLVSGSGSDSIGSFTWRGIYDKTKMICQMTKYYQSHSVFYSGYVDENGIWGTWTIGIFSKGGFHIWSKKGMKKQLSKS